MGTTRGVEEVEEAVADPGVRPALFEGNIRRLLRAEG
jgi:hypothetical protein